MYGEQLYIVSTISSIQLSSFPVQSYISGATPQILLSTFRLSQQTGVGIGNLPSCARTCLNQVVPTTKCSSTTDFSCLCSSPKSVSIITDCFHKQCDHVEFAQASRFLSTCSNYENTSTTEETNEKETDEYTTPQKSSNKTDEKENPNVIVINVPTPMTQVPSVSTMTSTPEKNSTTESSETKMNKSGVTKNEALSKKKSSKSTTPTNSDTDTDTDKEDSSVSNSTLSDTSDDNTNTTIKDKLNPTHFKKNGTEKYDSTSSASQSLLPITLILSGLSLTWLLS